MFGSLLITFRETLEASLIVGIVLGYLQKTKREQYNTVVYYGLFAAIGASILSAFLFVKIAGGFTGRLEEIFEGSMMLIAAGLLTFMILWMMLQKHIALALQQKVDRKLTEQQEFGLFSLVFVGVFREGIETVIFLYSAFKLTTVALGGLGAVIGILIAIIIGYLIYVGSKKLPLKTFFHVSSILLILFAAGLVAHGIHEFEEAELIPQSNILWDINPPVTVEGSYPALHEKGVIGSLLKGLFGYNGNPSLFEVVGYAFYLVLIAGLYLRIERQKA